MPGEHALVIGREKILRPPPRPFPLDHRIDRDVADPELLHDYIALLLSIYASGRPALRRPSATRIRCFRQIGLSVGELASYCAMLNPGVRLSPACTTSRASSFRPR